MLREKLGAFSVPEGGEGSVEKGDAWAELSRQISYLSGYFEDDALYAALAECVSGNVFFYLAVPPKVLRDNRREARRTRADDRRRRQGRRRSVPAGRGGEAVRSRPRFRAGAQPAHPRLRRRAASVWIGVEIET